jgi:FkbM family methyltransferase
MPFPDTSCGTPVRVWHPSFMGSTGEEHRLIVDLGMHRGDDTDFYLRKGFKVLAVEAAPHLVEQGKERFKDALDSGQLTIWAVAVADYEGEIDFFLSDEDLWASTRADMADRGQGRVRQKITVPCTTLDRILANHPTPYYVKIDVEGQDRNCIAALRRLNQVPRYVSFEADLAEPAETGAMLSALEDCGYRRFKLVNQAVHPMRRMPNPPLEGKYIDARFTKHSSGPFGEESPGVWLTCEQIRDRFHQVIKQQSARIEYSTKGSVFGLPVARFHQPLMWLYNSKPVTWARIKYAERRGIEVGSWFDIHATL